MATVDTVGVKYEGDVSDLRKQLDSLIAENKRLLGQVDGIGREYKQSAAEGTAAVKSLDKETTKLKSSTGQVGGMVSKLGPMLAAAFSTAAIISFGKQVLDVTGKFQRYAAVLTNTLGSTSEAQKALRMIQDFAAKTPFSVDELTSSFVKLANQGFQPTRAEMTKLGDLASSTGKSFDMLAEAIIDAQTGEFERLKEFGIRAQKEGDNVKFSFKGVETQTQFTSEAIQQYILSLGELEGVTGGMAAISKTLEGQISNLGDAWDQFLLSIGGAIEGEGGGLISALTASLGFLSDAVRSVNDPIKFALEEARKALDEFQSTTIEKAQAYSAKMTAIQVEAEIDRLETMIAIRHAAFIKAESEGDKEASIMAQNLIGRYRLEIETLQDVLAKKEGSEKKAEEKRQAEWAKGADKRKADAERLEQDLLKKEFEAQALRISLMDEGIEKRLLTLQLNYLKEQNQFRDNNAAKILLEQQFQKDLAKLQEDELFAELGRQEEKQEKDAKFTEDFIKMQEDELQAEIERQERKTEIDKQAEEDRKENAQKTNEDRIAIAESSFAAISAIGNALIQDEMKRAQFQKAVSLFQIGVSTAEAIAKGVAASQSIPFPGNLVAIAATVAAVFANIAQAKAILSSSPTPAFKDGVIDLQGPGTETSDSIHARLSKRESVMTAEETKKYKSELLAMRNGNYEEFLMAKYIMPALQKEKAQSSAQNMATSFMLNQMFDDTGIIRTIEKNKPATAKDIKRLGNDISKGLEKAAYKQSKMWRAN